MVKRLCPKRALLIGMTHEFDHYNDNEFLSEWSKRYNLLVFLIELPTFEESKKTLRLFMISLSLREGIHVQLAHDGLKVRVDL